MAKLYFYYAAMNAGKTTILLQSDYNYRERGMGTLLFTPIIDNRYQVGQISSRIGLSAPALSFDTTFNFFEYIRDNIPHHTPPLKCILIDEAQFLTKAQVNQLADIVDQFSIPILTYGLRSDFMGEPFEGSQYLLILAEELIEIKAVCHCGRKATMNMRINEHGAQVRTGAQIEIGGNERYIATCRKHFNLHVPKE